jgi:HAMP domain-containing protein
MGIRTKFNLALFFVFLLGFAVSGAISYELLRRNARAEIVRHAELMMEAALAIRGYTVNQVRPHLEAQLAREFLPQSVPAYAATETLNDIRKKHPDYQYKEATLNPTNPRNRAADWEADLVNAFRNASGETREIIGERETPTGPSLYIARPIRINNGACLACHSVPAAAPPTMLKLYGSANGFNWKLNEVIGAQVVSVPMSVPIKNAERAFTTFMGSLLAVFVFAFVVLNLMLSWMIIQPIRRMSQAADKVSTGDFAVEELDETGKDEISVLGASFNRMRRSLQKAMQMIDA